TSASMAERDEANPAPQDDEHGGEPITRWQALKRTWLAPSYQAELNEAADVRVFSFDQALAPASLDQVHATTPAGRSTDLFGAVVQAMGTARSRDGSGDGIKGVVLLLSDGHDTGHSRDPGLASRMTNEGWRLFAVPVGSARRGKDIALSAWADADFLLADQSTWINATVTQTGFDGRRVRVDLLHEGRLVESRELTFDAATSRKLRFRVTGELDGHAGTIHGYRVSATLLPADAATARGREPEDEERYKENNSRWVFLQVSPDKIKVALFEARPYWDTRFLARVLREDAQVELTAVYQLGSGRVVTITGDDTTQRDADLQGLTPQTLNQYDVVVLGRGVEQFFGGHRAQWLVDYVRQRGGALVLARGRPFDLSNAAGRKAQQVLAGVEPVEWGRQTARDLALRLTPQGRTSPLLQFEDVGSMDAVLTKLPDMLAATRVQRERAASIVLLRQASNRSSGDDGPAMAAVATQNVGSGRVLAVLTEGLWRWAFLPSTLGQYDSVYQVFWAKAIRWLATGGEFLPGQSVTLSMSRLAVEPGEPVEVTVATRYAETEDFAPALQLIGPDGTAQDVALVRRSEQSSRYIATVRPQTPGVHQVVLSTPTMQPAVITGRLAVYDQSEELRDPSARPAVLAQISEATGGRCLGLDQGRFLLDYLESLRQARITDTKTRYVFDRPMVFALIAGFFGLEWLLRRRNSLL
ncbi:MAG: hypothetical protein V3U29_06540, partial [Phycisphaeraceae bacterium]